ncbi:excisionase [Leucobacter sp. UCD-THU]|uniref:DUF2637 domain-containing protein n=1 Tax=unclassified Leucobacter TaxID=2621730 RepID=UPI000377F4D9|nr:MULTISPECIES: DUF2637 domain-containing protein [unclassified Leucobacter]EYT56773.1 excisionase [Leucobacter sp. UCD-THU]RGE16504.1 DUF2637 domain-containing protein [Leucobacter sp. wl10]
MTTTVVRGGGRLAVVTAVAGTVLIAAGAFWLSFTSLADLARRSGIDVGQAWAWPLIVDGIIVVATVAVVALAGTRQAWYPWLLLICGAGLSVTANSIHALVAADADVPGVLAASVAAVPPVVLLSITHLTVILTRHHNTAPANPEETFTTAEEGAALPVSSAVVSATFPLPSIIDARPAVAEAPRAVPGGRGVAEALRAEGWSNKKIARHLGVHASTVGRWFVPDQHTVAGQTPEPAEDDLEPELDPASVLDEEEEPS